MLDLCQDAKQQPISRSIINLLLASAQLQIAMTANEADALVTHLLTQHNVETQHLLHCSG